MGHYSQIPAGPKKPFKFMDSNHELDVHLKCCNFKNKDNLRISTVFIKDDSCYQVTLCPKWAKQIFLFREALPLVKLLNTTA